jgi:membrane-bound metal-dependent hydrolase YbcI (DUF457 family)
MFIGHYSAALALRAVRKSPPLWVLFVAVQAVDYLWAGLILAGIERARIVPGLMAASDLDLVHMPISHSLAGALIWSVLAGTLWGMYAPSSADRAAQGRILGLAVFSHWLLDLLVHRPDLPVFGSQAKVGLGLWDQFWLSQGLELGLLIGGFVLWMRASTSRPGGAGRMLPGWTPWAMLVLLIAIQAAQHVPGIASPDIAQRAIQALFFYTLLAGVAALADRTRIPRAG